MKTSHLVIVWTQCVVCCMYYICVWMTDTKEKTVPKSNHKINCFNWAPVSIRKMTNTITMALGFISLSICCHFHEQWECFDEWWGRWIVVQWKRFCELLRSIFSNVRMTNETLTLTLYNYTMYRFWFNFFIGFINLTHQLLAIQLPNENVMQGTGFHRHYIVTGKNWSI